MPTMLGGACKSTTIFLNLGHIRLDLLGGGSIAVRASAELVRPIRGMRTWPWIGGTGKAGTRIGDPK